MVRKFLASLSMAAALAFALPASAEQAPKEEEDKRLDTVTVFGEPHPIYGDGMALFAAGEYEAADVEFRRIAKRVKWGQESLETSARFARLSPEGSLGGSVDDPVVARIRNDQSSAFVDAYQANGQRGERVRKLDQRDIGFAKYMAGLSQIQLGQYDKARQTLYSSVRYEKSIDDAYFRIGLLELYAGNTKKVEKQIKELEKRVERCTPNCIDLAGNDVDANLELLKKGLAQLQSGELQFN